MNVGNQGTFSGIVQGEGVSRVTEGILLQEVTEWTGGIDQVIMVGVSIHIHTLILIDETLTLHQFLLVGAIRLWVVQEAGAKAIINLGQMKTTNRFFNLGQMKIAGHYLSDAIPRLQRS